MSSRHEWEPEQVSATAPEHVSRRTLLERDLAAAGREHVGRPCTLNGRDATISGRACDFAHVRELEGVGHVEYAWATVARVMEAGGAFRA